jgi:hypothetical protein
VLAPRSREGEVLLALEQRMAAEVLVDEWRVPEVQQEPGFVAGEGSGGEGVEVRSPWLRVFACGAATFSALTQASAEYGDAATLCSDSTIVGIRVARRIA